MLLGKHCMIFDFVWSRDGHRGSQLYFHITMYVLGAPVVTVGKIGTKFIKTGYAHD
jgi:hypothetical protein